MKLFIVLLALLCSSAHAAPCLDLQPPTHRVDGSAMRPSEIAGYKINWERIRPRDGKRLIGQTALLNSFPHCFNSSRSYRYTFTAITVDTLGQESAPSASVRWGAW